MEYKHLQCASPHGVIKKVVTVLPDYKSLHSRQANTCVPSVATRGRAVNHSERVLFPEDFFEFRFHFVGAIAAGATVDNLSGGVDDDGCREGGDVETAGYAGGVAMQLADVRPVHLEFLGEFL